MPLYVGSIVINVADIKKEVAFWTQALGYKVRSGDDTFVVLTDPKRRWSNLSLQLSDKPKQELHRLHLDLYTNQQKVEVARLEQLGATQVAWDYPPLADFIVMADPEGNEFCIIQTDTTQC